MFYTRLERILDDAISQRITITEALASLGNEFNHELYEMSKDPRVAICSKLGQIIAHMLKLKYQPNKKSSSWTNTFRNESDKIFDLAHSKNSKSRKPYKYTELGPESLILGKIKEVLRHDLKEKYEELIPNEIRKAKTLSDTEVKPKEVYLKIIELADPFESMKEFENKFSKYL